MYCPKCMHDKLIQIDVIDNVILNETYYKYKCPYCQSDIYAIKYETVSDNVIKAFERKARGRR